MSNRKRAGLSIGKAARVQRIRTLATKAIGNTKLATYGKVTFKAALKGGIVRAVLKHGRHSTKPSQHWHKDGSIVAVFIDDVAVPLPLKPEHMSFEGDLAEARRGWDIGPSSLFDDCQNDNHHHGKGWSNVKPIDVGLWTDGRVLARSWERAKLQAMVDGWLSAR